MRAQSVWQATTPIADGDQKYRCFRRWLPCEASKRTPCNRHTKWRIAAGTASCNKHGRWANPIRPSATSEARSRCRAGIGEEVCGAGLGVGFSHASSRDRIDMCARRMRPSHQTTENRGSKAQVVCEGRGPVNIWASSQILDGAGPLLGEVGQLWADSATYAGGQHKLPRSSNLEEIRI